ncbi:hypothetical protein PS943_02556 [Pseudomonas fluorescens]|uniref:Uncharacterized protein n=1 Tax=Pseudomonas fluorescens TaxID=294 RepID=A0A5E7WAM5_PSEFL|nr:hypothetical protein PS943_02556 [Pseudomonas fluorescens]
MPLTLALSPRGEGTDRGVWGICCDLRLQGDLGLAKLEFTLIVQVDGGREIAKINPLAPWGEG